MSIMSSGRASSELERVRDPPTWLFLFYFFEKMFFAYCKATRDDALSSFLKHPSYLHYCCWSPPCSVQYCLLLFAALLLQPVYRRRALCSMVYRQTWQLYHNRRARTVCRPRAVHKTACHLQQHLCRNLGARTRGAYLRVECKIASR